MAAESSSSSSTRSAFVLAKNLVLAAALYALIYGTVTLVSDTDTEVLPHLIAKVVADDESRSLEECLMVPCSPRSPSFRWLNKRRSHDKSELSAL